MLINEGDRVITDTGKKGRVELIGGFGLVAYVQLEGSARGAHLTLFDSHTLTVIGDADKAEPAPIVGERVNRTLF